MVTEFRQSGLTDAQWCMKSGINPSTFYNWTSLEGLRYSLNQEKQLRVFLADGNVPIDNSASERSIRTFCVGRNNWLFMNSIQGAQASAVIYSLNVLSTRAFI